MRRECASFLFEKRKRKFAFDTLNSQREKKGKKAIHFFFSNYITVRDKPFRPSLSFSRTPTEPTVEGSERRAGTDSSRVRGFPSFFSLRLSLSLICDDANLNLVVEEINLTHIPSSLLMTLSGPGKRFTRADNTKT